MRPQCCLIWSCYGQCRIDPLVPKLHGGSCVTPHSRLQVTQSLHCSKSLRRSKTTTSHRQGKKGGLEVWRPSIGHLLMKIPASTKMSTCIYETNTMAHADWQIFLNKASCWCLRRQKHTVLLLSVLDRSSIP